jgi:hypothetical protein
MTRPARTVFVFGVYLFLLSAILLIAPNLLLTLFGAPTTNEGWIRVVGMLVFLLGFYYVQAARKNLAAFFPWTIPARASVIVFLTVFVLLGFLAPVLILFGAVDLAGAVWTWLALRASRAA